MRERALRSCDLSPYFSLSLCLLYFDTIFPCSRDGDSRSNTSVRNASVGAAFHLLCRRSPTCYFYREHSYLYVPDKYACRLSGYMHTPHIHTGHGSFIVDTRPNFKTHQDDPKTNLTQVCTHAHTHTPVNGSQAITELRSAFGNLPPATVSRFVSMPLSPAPDDSNPKPLILDFSLCVCVCACVCVALSASACEQCRCLRRVHHGEAMTPFVFLQPTPRAQLCAGSSARCGVCVRGCGACVRAQSLAFGLLLPVCLFVCLSR